MKSILLDLLLAISFFTSLSTAAVVVVTVTAPPSIPSNEPSYSKTSLFTSAVLNSTNFYRREHNATSVRWNKTLASFASSYLASSNCNFAHSGGPYGENLAIGYANATAGVEAWGNERKKYSFDDPKFTHDTGHFTQLVWKSTKDVGCGRRLCGTRGWYLACEYWPRGNVGGQYGQQVDRQVSEAATLTRANIWTVMMVWLAFVLFWIW